MDANMPEGGMGQGEQGGQGNNPEQPSAPQADVKGLLNQLEAMLDLYMVKKAPFALPLNAKEIIVKVAPYLILIFALIAVPAVLAIFGLTAALAPFAMMGGYAYGGWGMTGLLSGVIAVASLVVELCAVRGLFNRTKGGWRLVYYASLISLVGSLISFNILGGAINAIIGWYFLFQVKDMYKN